MPQAGELIWERVGCMRLESQDEAKALVNLVHGRLCHAADPLRHDGGGDTGSIEIIGLHD